MKPDVQAFFRKYSIEHEGFTPFMYADTLNLVTTGIGNLIDASARNSFNVSPAAMAPAMNLPWKHRGPGWTSRNPVGGSPASASEIANAWTTVKLAEQESPGFNQHGGFVGYPGLTSLTLDMDGIDQLVASKMRSNEAELRKLYPNWDSLPADAQMGMMSMAWAMGSHFFPVLGFQNFKSAIDRQDFAAAADASTFKGGGSVTDAGDPAKGRPASRNYDNHLMFRNADVVTKGGGDPDRLIFPGTSGGVTGPSRVASTSNSTFTNALLAASLVGALYFGARELRKTRTGKRLLPA